VAGCPTEPATHPRDILPPEDEWSKLPHSQEWLYATGEFSGPHKAECDHVLGWVKGEDACKASLCEHGRDLAAEWLTRCPALEEPPIVESARSVQVALTARAGEAPTECGKKLDAIVRDGCGDDATCAKTGQRWATRCAKSEGTPLTMRILQRVIERRAEQGTEPWKLDPRTCDELQKDVAEAGKCKDRFVCQEAIPRVETYRERCESEGERPSIVTAVHELTVLVGGGKPPEAILTKPGSPALGPTDVPVALADGSGGVIFVCEERASDLARYMGSRKTCQGGKMVVARAFPTAKGVEVRVGALDFPDEASFSARYPTILASGEIEARDREAGAALEASLDQAVEKGKSSGTLPEAVRLLTRAMSDHALAIKRSASVKTALAKRDEALVPVLKEIAKTKLAAGKGFKVPPADAAGLFARARTRAFADLGPDGGVQIGARGRGFTLDTAALLPRGMEAYLAVLKPARPRKLDAKSAAAEKARGMTAAQVCGDSEKKLQEVKKSLVICNFGLEFCDDARHISLAKSVDEARLAAEAAFHDLDAARTADAEDADALNRAAGAAGCREPWW
jgi:hypothetical protein